MNKTIIFTFFFLLISSFSQARIHIFVDQATSQKIPVAVAPFVNLKEKETKISREVTNLVRTDLAISGLFKVLSESSYLEISNSSSSIDFSKWTSINAHALVTGIVDGSKSNTTIELRLYDTNAEKLVVGKQYNVDRDDYYKAVHMFMDEIMQSTTGTSGPFNSEIVAACGPSSNKQIKVFRIDGTGDYFATKNKTNNISPTWSPDGDTIAFTSFYSYYPELFSIDKNNSKSFKQLTRNQATNITPAYSPQGYFLAFASSRSNDTEIYLMDRRGKIVKRITKSYSIDISPTWSPNGKELVFSSERSGGLHLFKTNVESGVTSRLTFTGYQNDQPDWSPNNDKIVFTSRDEGTFDIFIMNTDGSSLQRITRAEGSNESPSFSPDGRYISFSSRRNGTDGIYVMKSDGNNQLPIPNTKGCINPEWGPRIK